MHLYVWHAQQLDRYSANEKKRYIAIHENEIKTHISRYTFFDHDWVTRECREQNRLFGNRTEPWPHPHTTDQLTNRHSTTLFVMPFLKMIGDKWFLFFSPNQVWKNYKGFAFDHKVGRDVPTSEARTSRRCCDARGQGNQRRATRGTWFFFFFWIREGRDWWCFPFPSPISI